MCIWDSYVNQKDVLCFLIDECYIRPVKRYCFIIIIIVGISFMRGIYTYIPETNHVPREHRVATILM